ncbi:hypothetical protein C8J27_101101 [Rhodobacter aestuarii]|uniref:Uncharacterized protein n=1 Tax=Rhodobacter aestuarii TaxID=453582 RepID=A0A1N7JAW9_9RHOB|nr:hypothetical protein [Rhodobacter aestuarii]PTV96993.1 hypothetical protein C8J27_101101 [Rhodobacter aestuarii]SIS46416.1 hypothetical protein SAMN05421580_101541 [Rhodobacter aestuarii]
MNPLWLMRMAKWAHHPPSLRQVKIGAAVLAAVLAIWGLEAAGLWPDWATLERQPRVPRL